MEIPLEFDLICQRFFQDIDTVANSPERMVEFVTRGLDARQKRASAEFIDQLLSGGYSDEQLQGIWFKSRAEIYFQGPGQLRQLLLQVSRALQV